MDQQSANDTQDAENIAAPPGSQDAPPGSQDASSGSQDGPSGSQDASAPAGLDLSRPSVARMYDYYLGGKNNYPADREAVEMIASIAPEFRQTALENRAFLRRAVRFMAGQGIRQFIDIGSGLPTAGNTHEIAQQVTPDARVVYVDNDPVVTVHGQALLATDASTTVINGDLRRPDEVLGHPETTRLIDFNEPVGLLMIAVTHFLSDDEYPALMRRLREAVPMGSMLALTHAVLDGRPAEEQDSEQIDDGRAVYASASMPIFLRPMADLAGLLEGFELVEPGLVTLDAWRPDPEDPAPLATNWLAGAVGTKRA